MCVWTVITSHGAQLSHGRAEQSDNNNGPWPESRLPQQRPLRGQYVNRYPELQVHRQWASKGGGTAAIFPSTPRASRLRAIFLRARLPYLLSTYRHRARIQLVRSMGSDRPAEKD